MEFLQEQEGRLGAMIEAGRREVPIFISIMSVPALTFHETPPFAVCCHDKQPSLPWGPTDKQLSIQLCKQNRLE